MFLLSREKQQWLVVSLQQLHIPALPAWMWPPHRFCPAPAPLEHRGRTDSSKEESASGHGRHLLPPQGGAGAQWKLQTALPGRGGTPGKPRRVTCGNSEWGQPGQTRLCGTVPVSLKQWLPCDMGHSPWCSVPSLRHPQAVSSRTLSDHAEELLKIFSGRTEFQLHRRDPGSGPLQNSYKQPRALAVPCPQPPRVPPTQPVLVVT